jgi:hypothetical protein
MNKWIDLKLRPVIGNVVFWINILIMFGSTISAIWGASLKLCLQIISTAIVIWIFVIFEAALAKRAKEIRDSEKK